MCRWLLLLTVLLPSTARPAAAAAPSLDEQVLRVLAAFRAGDAGALGAIAAEEDPEPFVVAHDLALRGEFDVAEAYAAALPRRPRNDGIAEYLAMRRDAVSDPKVAATIEPLRRATQMRGRPAEVLALLEPFSDPAGLPDPLTAARILWVRGFAYECLGRFADAVADYEVLIPLAAKAGWKGGVVAGTFRAGICCEAANRAPEEVTEWQRRLAAANETMEEPPWLAWSLARYGASLVALGRVTEARPVLERASVIEQTLPADLLHRDVAILLARGCEGLEQGARAGDLFERAAAIAEAEGQTAWAISDLIHAGRAFSGYEPRRGVAPLEKAARMAEEAGDRGSAAAARAQLGTVRIALGDLGAAFALHQESLRFCEAVGDLQGVLMNRIGLGDIHDARGEFREALAVYQRNLAMAEEKDLAHEAAMALNRLGLVYMNLGDFAKALDCHRRSRDYRRPVGSTRADLADTANIAYVLGAMGEYPRAFATYDEALREYERIGDPAGIAGVRFNLGTLLSTVGDPERGLAMLKQALEHYEAERNEKAIGSLVGNMGTAYAKLGDLERAEACFTRSRDIAVSRGDRLSLLHAEVNLAHLLRQKGNAAGAAAVYERLLAASDDMGVSGGGRALRCALARCRILQGEARAAVPLLERVIRDAERARAAPELLEALSLLAEAHFTAGHPDLALSTARRAIPYLEAVGDGEADEQASALRGEHGGIFRAGAFAAAEVGDAAEVSYFLESGRALALLESLTNRDALRAAALPPDVREREASARQAQTTAAGNYAKALAGGVRAEIEARGRELDEAEARLKETTGALQRAQKAAASILYPRAATLEEIQGALAPAEALVAYEITPKGALALVLSPKEARIVPLGSSEPIRAACEALAFTGPGGDPAGAAARAARLLIEPLRLGRDVKRVLVSPDAAASYAPFALLLPDREVACVPSGTAWLAMREERARVGKGVLAIGDPDYGRHVDAQALAFYARETRGGRGRDRLARLPATAAEAKAVGDRVLLGAEATEEGVLAALAARSRWRAVHFACHGLVDPERPAFSSLALSASEGNDGFLTVLDVFRARVPADLAVLSACETAKGKVVAGEGIVGLTRAFLFAGTPRVICSLWKVDDAATAALMTKFYALWNPKDGSPGLPAAQALKAAQDFVRSQEQWQHPYYWAAWVLWGLAE